MVDNAQAWQGHSSPVRQLGRVAAYWAGMSAKDVESVRDVHLGTVAELDRMSAALGAAFEEDPVFEWLIRDGSRRRERLVRFFRLELEHVVLPAGAAWTTDGVAGASLELPPGAWKMPFGVQLAHGREFVRVFGAGLPRAMALITKVERRHLREPHYYIAAVGVAPQAQGEGLGTALLHATLDRCDREGLPAYLEATSRRNVALYERLGFEHLGEFNLGSSPPLWPMRRRPATPADR
jgi:GNAT superfamily N-acetyltransferase